MIYDFCIDEFLLQSFDVYGWFMVEIFISGVPMGISIVIRTKLTEDDNSDDNQSF